MKLKGKRLVASALLMLSLGLVAGCGSSDKIGAVDMAKVGTESAKAKEISAKLETKFAEINNRLVAAQGSQSEEEFAKTQEQAQQEFTVYKQAMANEFRSNLEATVAAVAKEKGFTIVQDKGAVLSGAEDITEEVMKKMDAASSTETQTTSGNK